MLQKTEHKPMSNYELLAARYLQPSTACSREAKQITTYMVIRYRLKLCGNCDAAH